MIMANGKWVSYLRVSTDRQGRSGLDLEAQREAVAGYLNGGRWKLIDELVEIEHGDSAIGLSLKKLSGPAACTRPR
jgi:DNA invertase Pin-like site-specific DNA recombinase